MRESDKAFQQPSTTVTVRGGEWRGGHRKLAWELFWYFHGCHYVCIWAREFFISSVGTGALRFLLLYVAGYEITPDPTWIEVFLFQECSVPGHISGYCHMPGGDLDSLHCSQDPVSQHQPESAAQAGSHRDQQNISPSLQH